MATTERPEGYVAAARMGLVSVARRYLSTPIDALVQGANALLLIAVLWAHRTLPHAAAYAACHVLFALGLYLLSRPVDVATARFDPLSFFHSWLPALVAFQPGGAR